MSNLWEASFSLILGDTLSGLSAQFSDPYPQDVVIDCPTVLEVDAGRVAVHHLWQEQRP